MKKIIWILLCLLIVLCSVGCRRTMTDASESRETSDSSDDVSAAPEIAITITFINEVEKTDVWILPSTKENKKLTLWGTATLGLIDQNEERVCPLPASENGAYVIHMITPDGIYYGVSDIPLEEVYTVRFYKETDPYIVWYVAVADTIGQEIDTYEVFSAAL